MSEAATDARDEVTPVRDPRHVFLDAREVMRRYGWGKTKGYQNLKDRDLVPPPVMTHPDRWRLDQLLAWEDRRIAAAESGLVAAPEVRRPGLQDLLPPPKRASRKSA
jgi:predicted DNA-binding transcriptional regulator AlpA